VPVGRTGCVCCTRSAVRVALCVLCWPMQAKHAQDRWASFHHHSLCLPPGDLQAPLPAQVCRAPAELGVGGATADARAVEVRLACGGALPAKPSGWRCHHQSSAAWLITCNPPAAAPPSPLAHQGTPRDTHPSNPPPPSNPSYTPHPTPPKKHLQGRSGALPPLAHPLQGPHPRAAGVPALRHHGRAGAPVAGDGGADRARQGHRRGAGWCAGGGWFGGGFVPRQPVPSCFFPLGDSSFKLQVRAVSHATPPPPRNCPPRR